MSHVSDTAATPASAGIAPNKFLAKIASDWNKPNGQFVIKPEDITEMRNVVAAVAKQTKLTLLQYCEREAGQKDKASIGLRALADRFKKNMG